MQQNLVDIVLAAILAASILGGCRAKHPPRDGDIVHVRDHETGEMVRLRAHPLYPGADPTTTGYTPVEP